MQHGFLNSPWHWNGWECVDAWMKNHSDSMGRDLVCGENSVNRRPTEGRKGGKKSLVIGWHVGRSPDTDFAGQKKNACIVGEYRSISLSFVRMFHFFLPSFFFVFSSSVLFSLARRSIDGCIKVGRGRNRDYLFSLLPRHDSLRRVQNPDRIARIARKRSEKMPDF